MLFVRNDFIENDALNFVFSMIDRYKSLRVDYALSAIYGSTGLCYDTVLYVIDIYNQVKKNYKSGACVFNVTVQEKTKHVTIRSYCTA